MAWEGLVVICRVEGLRCCTLVVVMWAWVVRSGVVRI